MSPDPRQTLRPPWSEFLAAVDQRLDDSLELHCLGGFVLSALYGLPRPTGDLDYIAALPAHRINDLERIAGRGSALSLKHGLYFQYVTVAEVPEDYTDRLADLCPGRFLRLRLLALEVHDLVLAKLVRNSPVDLEDAAYLARSGRLDEGVLRRRYEKELRPNLANEKRHDLTLKIWLETCFHS